VVVEVVVVGIDKHAEKHPVQQAEDAFTGSEGGEM
jgi:hypothetical protein